MPHRIIKDTIRTSKTVNAMNDFQFRLWTYLITYVDDYGRGSADPEIVKGFVFPRLKRVRETDIKDGLAALAGMGAIRLYEVDGESLLCFPGWGDHQRIRTKIERFPPPPDNLPQVAASCGELPPESNPIQNPNPNPESESIVPGAVAPGSIFELPLNDGSEYPISQAQHDGWCQLYPAVDVMQALRNMRGWLQSNPKRRKTSRGIQQFITGWLSREQDRGRPKQGGRKSFVELAEEMEVQL